MIGTVCCQAVCANVVSAISGLTVCTDVIGAVCCEAVCTDVVSAIGGLTVCTDVVGTVCCQAIRANMIGAIRGLTVRTSVRSVSVRRTTFRNNSAIQCRMSVRNRQSESARCQDGKTKAKQDI